MEISSSEARTWLRCRRKWWLQYYRGVQQPQGDNSPSNVGNLVHKALEIHYGTATLVDPLDALLPMIADMLKNYPQYAARIEMDAELARTMIRAYIHWIEEEMVDLDLEFFAVESDVRVDIPDTNHKIRAKIDARMNRKSTGNRVNMDNKTVKSLGEIPKTAQIDFQFLTYDLVEFLLSGQESKAEAFIVNMLRRVNSDHQNAKPPFFERYEIQHNVQQLRSHMKHIVSICDEIERVMIALEDGGDHHELVYPSPCKDCAWDCFYRGICPMFDDGSNVEGFIAANYSTGTSYTHQVEPREKKEAATVEG